MQRIEVAEVMNGINKALEMKSSGTSEQIIFTSSETTLGYFKNRP
jgi:hypothetical protein